MARWPNVVKSSTASAQKPGKYDAQVEGRIEKFKGDFKSILWLSEEIKDIEDALKEGENLSIEQHIDAMALFAIIQEQREHIADLNRETKNSLLSDLLRDADKYIETLPKGPQQAAERLPKVTMDEAVADKVLSLIIHVWSLQGLRHLAKCPDDIKDYENVEWSGFTERMINRSIALAQNFYIQRWYFHDAALLKR